MWQRIVLVGLLVSGVAIGVSAGLVVSGQAAIDTTDQAAIQEAAGWIARSDNLKSEYRYVMTGKLRLLFFWTGRDDVGGGYVRMGTAAGDGRQKMIRVLFGSDPAKAPLSINRWGAGTEVLRLDDSGRPVASAFFGFMKSSKGQSVVAMRDELSKEKANGNHRFEGIISRVDEDRALSTTVPFESARDFDLRQYADAEKATLRQLEGSPARHIRRLNGTARNACPRIGGFLSTTFDLIDDAMAGRPAPAALCYIYNARHYTVTLQSVRPIEEKRVRINLRKGGAFDHTYRHLKEAHFEVVGEETGSRSLFVLMLGTEGNLRGAPVQIIYQPNWWFQIILNLAPDSPQLGNPVAPAS